jgi:hypothetical protein
VEFIDVPAGLAIAGTSASRINLQLRGSSWLMNSADVARLIVRFSLKNAKAGSMTLHVGVGNLDLPPGIILDAPSPADVTVRLVRTAPPK